MKISKKRLKQIVKEEVEAFERGLQEGHVDWDCPVEPEDAAPDFWDSESEDW